MNRFEVRSLGGDDRIEMLSPILIDVLIDAGVGDDDQLTVMGPASSGTFTPFEEPRSGRLVTQRHGDRQTVDYSGVETLAARFSTSGTPPSTWCGQRH
ncbi:MAG: hypothetical protein R3C56_19500 [Pirellulaceae bacterium]